MTLEIETGTASATAEAYISVTDADAYFAARGITIWAPITTAEKEQAIRRGCDYLSQTYRGRWLGSRINGTQALDWPRTGVSRIDYAALYAIDSVPSEVRNANAEAALRAAAGELIEDLAPQVKSESVGPLSTEYFQGGSRTKKYPVIEKLLSPLLAARTLRVGRS